MDILLRLPGCSGQTADAVSPKTQDKMEDPSTLLKISKLECPDTRIRPTEAQTAQIMVEHGRPQLFLLKGICTVILWQGLLWQRQFEKILLIHGWEKVPNWECLFVNREKELLLSVYVDDIKLAGMTENIEPTWKISMKDVDLGEPTSFLDHVLFVGCTQRKCQIRKDVLANYRDRYVRIQGFLLEPKKSYRGNLMQKQYLLGPMTWKVTQRNVWKDIANLQIKTTQQLYKVATPCMDDHQFKEE